MLSLCRRLTALAVAAAVAGPAMAQQVITQWNFNNTSSGLISQRIPSTGLGTVINVGGTTINDVSGGTDGGSSDPLGTSASNRALNVTAFPAQSTGNRTAGIAFTVSTAGFNAITVGWDNRFSSTPSRYMRFQYSTTGASGPWIDGPLFTSTQQTFWYKQNLANPADRRIVDLSAVASVSNNPNFAFRVVSEFSPVAFTSPLLGGGSYAANAAYHEVGGGTNAYGTGGTARFDMVTVSGVDNGQPQSPGGNVSFDFSAVCAGQNVVITADVVPGTSPASTSFTVTANLTNLGGGAAVAMVRTDPANFPNRYQLTYTVPVGNTPGIDKAVPVTVRDNFNRQTISNGQITVTNCAITGQVRISQIYGAGGTTGAAYSQDYVELYNAGPTPANITGWSIQYSAAGAVPSFTDSQRLVLNATIPAGGYYLIRLIGFQPPVSGEPVAADAFLSTEAGVATGIFALRALPGSLGAGCTDVRISDIVVYGSENCAEGLVGAPRLNNRMAAFRRGAGCVDTGSNGADFYAAPPMPRNSSSPVSLSCPTAPVVTAAFDVATQCSGDQLVLTATVDTTADVFADLSDFQLSSAEPMVRQPDGSYQLVVATPQGTPGFRQANVYVVASDGRRDGKSARVELIGCNNFVSGLPEPLAICNNRCSTVRIAAFATRATTPPPGTISVFADLSVFGGDPLTPMFDDGTNGDITPGDDVFAVIATARSGLLVPGVVVPIIITDDTNRRFINHIFVNVVSGCEDVSQGLRISQVYAGAGLTNAAVDGDFVELYNSSNAPINLAGKSLQYGFDTGAIVAKVDLTGTVPAKSYWLIRLSQEITGFALPAADQDASPFVNANASSGKFALVNGTTLLNADLQPLPPDFAPVNPNSNPTVIDFVGYGSTANTFEGSVGPTITPSATLSIKRELEGCQDTNNNAADFRTSFLDTSGVRNSSNQMLTCPSAPECQPLCAVDYNRDSILNLDDLSDYITDFYFPQPIPGGFQPGAPQGNSQGVGFGFRCPLAPNAPPPYPVDAYRRTGYRTGFSFDGSNTCPTDPEQNFPNLDNLSEFITLYYTNFGFAPC